LRHTSNTCSFTLSASPRRPTFVVRNRQAAHRPERVGCSGPKWPVVIAGLLHQNDSLIVETQGVVGHTPPQLAASPAAPDTRPSPCRAFSSRIKHIQHFNPRTVTHRLRALDHLDQELRDGFGFLLSPGGAIACQTLTSVATTKMTRTAPSCPTRPCCARKLPELVPNAWRARRHRFIGQMATKVLRERVGRLIARVRSFSRHFITIQSGPHEAGSATPAAPSRGFGDVSSSAAPRVLRPRARAAVRLREWSAGWHPGPPG